MKKKRKTKVMLFGNEKSNMNLQMMEKQRARGHPGPNSTRALETMHALFAAHALFAVHAVRTAHALLAEYRNVTLGKYGYFTRGE